jgi:hypothetical protein
VIELVRRDLSSLRGELFSLVEAVGMPARREHALKSCIRRRTYDAQARLEATLRGSDQ